MANITNLQLHPDCILEPLETVFKIDGRDHVKAKCRCGVVKTYRLRFLITGNIKSCGCYKYSLVIKRNTTHGLAKSPLYHKWLGLKDRCYNPNNKKFHNYGGRGITVCDEWKDNFLAFHGWSINNGWAKGLEIDRVDNDKEYSPNNCRYITHKNNIRNRGNSIKVSFNGNTKTIGEWAEYANVSYETIRTAVRSKNPQGKLNNILSPLFSPTSTLQDIIKMG